MVSRHHAASVSSASIRALLAAKSALRTLRHARDGIRTASAAGSKTLDHHRLLRTTIAEQAGNAIWARFVGELVERHGPMASALRDRFETPAAWTLAPDEHDAIRAAPEAGNPLLAQTLMHAPLDQPKRRRLDGDPRGSPARPSQLASARKSFSWYRRIIDADKFGQRLVLTGARRPVAEDSLPFRANMSMPQVLNVSENPRAPALAGSLVWPARAAFEGGLRVYYPEVVDLDDDSPLGQVLQRLSRALDAAADTAQGAAGFRRDLIAAVPHLRRFALSLTRDSVEAEDLVQFTLLKAWEHQARFAPGTRLIAWLFTILRNGYLNGRMKRRREIPDPDGAHAAKLSRPADQENRLSVRDLQAALDRLDPAQREALLLIAVDDLSYDEAAAIIGCPCGTVKSRVSRARDKLSRELGGA